MLLLLFLIKHSGPIAFLLGSLPPQPPESSSLSLSLSPSPPLGGVAEITQPMRLINQEQQLVQSSQTQGETRPHKYQVVESTSTSTPSIESTSSKLPTSTSTVSTATHIVDAIQTPTIYESFFNNYYFDRNVVGEIFQYLFSHRPSK